MLGCHQVACGRKPIVKHKAMVPAKQKKRSCRLAGAAATARRGALIGLGASLQATMRRRPRCRIGLWALVATALSLASVPGAVASASRTVRGISFGAGAVESSVLLKTKVGRAAATLRGGAAAHDGGEHNVEKAGQRETLYEAYNMLHMLAQVRWGQATSWCAWVLYAKCSKCTWGQPLSTKNLKCSLLEMLVFFWSIFFLSFGDAL